MLALYGQVNIPIKSNLGQTNVGTGQLSGVAIVKKSAFKAQSYSIARIRFNKTKELDPYSSTYQKIYR